MMAYAARFCNVRARPPGYANYGRSSEPPKLRPIREEPSHYQQAYQQLRSVNTLPSFLSNSSPAHASGPNWLVRTGASYV